MRWSLEILGGLGVSGTSLRPNGRREVFGRHVNKGPVTKGHAVASGDDISYFDRYLSSEPANYM